MKTKICIFLSVLLIVFIQNAQAFDKTRKSFPGNSSLVKKTVSKRPLKIFSNRAYAVAELTKNLEYDFGKAAIRTAYTEKLDQLAKYIIDNNYALSLRGYADSIGSFKGNWVISDKRATSVKKYLVAKGVAVDKIITTPFGSTKPIANNKTKEGRQRNRRVEIKLTEIK